MHKNFHVPKIAGTYADTLEAYGVAHLLSKILREVSHTLTINDKGIYYEVVASKPITEEVLAELKYFQVIKFIKKDNKQKEPENIGNDFFNYPEQRELRQQRKKEIEKAIKDSKGDEYKEIRKKIEAKYGSEAVKPLQYEYDVFAQLISNPYTAFLKLYANFEQNKKHFKTLIIEVLNHYLPDADKIPSDFKALAKAKEIKIDDKATMLQLINPNQGKGLNKAKAGGLSVGNLKGNWIAETMKLNGALNFGMLCQSIKVGSGYDMKIFVPAFNNIKLGAKDKLLRDFKKYAKSRSPIKLDILNLLRIIDLFIQNSVSYKGKLRDTLVGLHSVYQKDLGQNKAVVNIAFLETPDFIDIKDEDAAYDWRDIIEEQIKILNGITEQGDAMIGLLAYRKFWNGSDINEYFKFHYWYATYVMHELSNKKQTYVVTNKIQTLDKIFSFMNISFKEITENEGFQSIAKAIRKSTVSLQYTPKTERKFDVQYGVAQKLQNKSKSKDDLIAFVSEFIAKYNSDTARQREKTGQNLRANVKDKELADFFMLADKVSPRVLGAMLAAYGFALNKKEQTREENED